MRIPTPISGDLSLYFHLPFCTKKCDYCHFYVIPNKEEYKALLLPALLKEIEIKKKWLKNARIQSIYFGGGTPSLVGPYFLERLLNALSSITSIHGVEVTLEINPENHNLNLLKNFKHIGINRLSIGAQSFENKTLIQLGRSHYVEDFKLSLNNASLAGFSNISIDLMYELPNQTLKSWDETLKQTPIEQISHLSLYNLSIEPHTVFYKKRKEIQKKIPKAERGAKMFQKAIDFFKERGWSQYEISAFCKDQKYSRHNVGYWLSREHLGFGPSAFSFFEKKRFQNIPNLHKYCRQIHQSKLPVSFEEELEKEALLRESLALHLRLLDGFCLKDFQNRFGILSPSIKSKLKELIQKKFLTQNETLLCLTSKGVFYHDEIASEII